MCPIKNVQLIYNYDQCDVPKLEEAMNLLIDKRGVCQMKPLIDAVAKPKPRQVEDSPSLFSDQG